MFFLLKHGWTPAAGERSKAELWEKPPIAVARKIGIWLWNQYEFKWIHEESIYIYIHVNITWRYLTMTWNQRIASYLTMQLDWYNDCTVLVHIHTCLMYLDIDSECICERMKICLHSCTYVCYMNVMHAFVHWFHVIYCDMTWHGSFWLNKVMMVRHPSFHCYWSYSAWMGDFNCHLYHDFSQLIARCPIKVQIGFWWICTIFHQLQAVASCDVIPWGIWPWVNRFDARKS